MSFENISVQSKTKEILSQYYYKLKLEKKVKTWDDFINLLFSKYKVDVEDVK